MQIRTLLHAGAVRFDFFLHCPSPSATRFAGTLHVPGRVVAKAVLIRADDRPVLAVLPATHRVDLGRFALVLGAGTACIAPEADVLRLFDDCEPGALPPFGRPYGIETVVDASLAAGSEIVFVGNNRHEAVRMRFRDYEAVERPLRARFADPIGSRSPRRTA